MSVTYIQALEFISASFHHRIISGDLRVTENFRRFTITHSHHEIWLKLTAALAQNFEAKINGVITDTLNDNDKNEHLNQLRTSLQGVYFAHIPGDVNKGYVGCALSASGIHRRVFGDHLVASIRQAKPSKFYDAIEKAGDVSKIHWLLLVIFQTKQDAELIEWAEGCIMTLLDTIQANDYRKSRPTWLPHRDSEFGLNVAYPFKMANGDGVAENIVHMTRTRTVAKMNTAGAGWNVTRYNASTHGNRKVNQGFCFTVFYVSITIPSPLGKAWYSDNTGVCYAKFDISDGEVHPHKWAKEAKRGDPGARLGIRIYKTRDMNEASSCWLKRNKISGSQIANTMVSLMEGLILNNDFDFDAEENKDHAWIFKSSVNKRGGATPSSEGPGKVKQHTKKRKAVPFDWAGQADYDYRKSSQKLVKDPAFIKAAKEAERQRVGSHKTSTHTYAQENHGKTGGNVPGRLEIPDSEAEDSEEDLEDDHQVQINEVSQGHQDERVDKNHGEKKAVARPPPAKKARVQSVLTSYWK